MPVVRVSAPRHPSPSLLSASVSQWPPMIIRSIRGKTHFVSILWMSKCHWVSHYVLHPLKALGMFFLRDFSQLDTFQLGALRWTSTSHNFSHNLLQTMRACDFYHWLKSLVDPWNACAHNMKLINHDLKDKWILDIGSTNHGSKNPDLLDITTCLLPSIFSYLGNNEKLMANLNRLIEFTQDLNCCFNIP